MNIKNVIIVNLFFVVIIMSFVLFMQDKGNGEYVALIEQQQLSHLEKLNEFTANYNDLQDSYNTLYLNYKVLAAEKGFYDGWEEYLCTGYTSLDENCNAYSSTGINILKWSEYFNFCATDNQLIPYGSVVLVKFDTGVEPFLAVDCGGAITGKHLDLYFGNDLNKAFGFGVKELEVKVIR